jgi:hypothetical protein
LKNLIFALTLITTIISADAFAGRYSTRVTQMAEDYRDNLDGDRLYGMTYRNGLTQNGRLAYARVVQIVLMAGVPGFGGALYSVAQRQRKTRSWKKVSYDDIQSGDIVFWRKVGQDEICSGGGDCHVGIAVGNGQSFDNDGLWENLLFQELAIV